MKDEIFHCKYNTVHSRYAFKAYKLTLGIQL